MDSLNVFKLRSHLHVKSSMNNYIVHAMLENASQQQIKHFFISSNGTQIEQGLSGVLLYLPHSWKPSRTSRYCCLPRTFVRGTRKHVSGDTRKLFTTKKACGRQFMKVFIHEMLYLKQFRKFLPVKVPKYSIDEVIVCV